MAELIFKDEVYAIIGAAMEVYNTLVLNYLKATQYPLGLLINFGHPDELEWKRLVGDAATTYRITQSRRFIRED